MFPARRPIVICRFLALVTVLSSLATESFPSEEPLFLSSFFAFNAIPTVSAVSAGDFNGDGLVDLVVTGSQANSIAVLLNITHGKFAEPVIYRLGDHPTHVTVADLNGDGHLDLAIANLWGHSVTTLRGLGNGRFTQIRTIPAGEAPAWIAVGDMNRDGKPDLVVADSERFSGRAVVVILGRGDGTFESSISYPVGVGVRSVALADFDGDGWLDAGIGIEGGGTFIYMLPGDGAGGLGPLTSISSGYNPRVVVAADLNGDKHPDLVAAGFWSDNVSVHLGRGDGTFRDKLRQDTGAGPSCLAVADVNDDGVPDVVTANASYHTATVLLGSRSGRSFTRSDVGSGFGIGSNTVVDVDGDGVPDLVTAGSGSVFIHKGNGDGTFGTDTAVPVRAGPISIVASDWNGDGWPDLAVASSQAGTIQLLIGDGDGLPQPQASLVLGTTPTAIAAADFDRDGRQDLVVTTLRSMVSVFSGNGDGTFGVQREFPTGTLPIALAVADLNGDGHADVVTANLGRAPDFRDPQPTGPDSISILLGSGDGTLLPRFDLEVGFSPSAVAISDLNGDGVRDIAVTSALPGSSVVSLFFGNGDGTFRARSDLAVGSGPLDVKVADFNRDGIPDLVTADNAANSLSILLGLGGGSFAGAQPIAASGAPRALTVGDFNGDGGVDLAITSDNTNTVDLYLSHGDGTFEPAIRFGSWAGPYDLVALDVDRDFQLDLAVANRQSSTVTVLRSNGPGLPTPTRISLVSSEVEPGRVVLTWFTPLGPGAVAEIYRRQEWGPFQAVGGSVANGSGLLVFTDTSVTAGARYGYQANVQGAGTEDFSEEVWITVPENTGLALEGFSPNPTSLPVLVVFTLPTRDSALLEVFDAAGRRVAARKLLSVQPGRHEVTLGTLPNGVYLLRLTQGGQRVTTKSVVVR